MNTYEAKTEEEALNRACQDLGITPEEFHYEVVEVHKGLFSKKVVITGWCESMVEEYVGQFVERTLSSLGFETQTTVFKQDDRIYCNVETSNNSVVIGKNGVILRALNFITKSAVNTQFKERIEISVDINGYKEQRYQKVAAMAKRFGKKVQHSKINMKLDPLPADERKVIHQVIAEMPHLATQSHGEGKNRYLEIYYVD